VQGQHGRGEKKNGAEETKEEGRHPEVGPLHRA
jgi:hypothetical protein